MLIGMIVLALLVTVFIIVGSIFLIALPILIVLGILAFIIRKILPRKELKPAKKQNYIDAEFKVKG